MDSPWARALWRWKAAASVRSKARSSSRRHRNNGPPEGRRSQPAATRYHPTTGQGGALGHPGPWRPSRSAAGPDGAAAHRHRRRGCSARRTGARPITGRSCTPRIRHRRLDGASSVLELALLCVFMKPGRTAASGSTGSPCGLAGGRSRPGGPGSIAPAVRRNAGAGAGARVRRCRAGRRQRAFGHRRSGPSRLVRGSNGRRGATGHPASRRSRRLATAPRSCPPTCTIRTRSGAAVEVRFFCSAYGGPVPGAV